MNSAVKILIERSYTPYGTLGRLTAGGLSLWTIELPWRGNERNESCIPPGVYTTIKHDSPNHGSTLWLQEVPERSEILIHAANYPSQLDGCIAPGLRPGITSDELAVWDSRAALDKLLDAVEDEVTVEIRTYNPEYL